MTPSPQLPGLLSLLILILTKTTVTTEARPSANRVQQPANHGLMTSTAPHGGVCNDDDDDDDNENNSTMTTMMSTTMTARGEKEEEEEEKEEERHTVRIPEGVFAAFGPKTAANPLCGRTVGIAWRRDGGKEPGRATAVLVGYCDKCLGPIVGGVDVSPGLFAAAGGRTDAGGVVEVDWWLEG